MPAEEIEVPQKNHLEVAAEEVPIKDAPELDQLQVEEILSPQEEEMKIIDMESPINAHNGEPLEIRAESFVEQTKGPKQFDPYGVPSVISNLQGSLIDKPEMRTPQETEENLKNLKNRRQKKMKRIELLEGSPKHSRNPSAQVSEQEMKQQNRSPPGQSSITIM